MMKIEIGDAVLELVRVGVGKCGKIDVLDSSHCGDSVMLVKLAGDTSKLLAVELQYVTLTGEYKYYQLEVDRTLSEQQGTVHIEYDCVRLVEVLGHVINEDGEREIDTVFTELVEVELAHSSREVMKQYRDKYPGWSLGYTTPAYGFNLHITAPRDELIGEGFINE